MDYFAFLETDRDLATVIEGHYEPGLVLVSVLMITISAYTAFLISERVSATKKRGQYLAWLLTGAFTLGSGVWAMHFIGMLAYKLPVAVSYDATTTVVSAVPAVLASLIVFRITREQNIKTNTLLGWSVLMGGGIGLMHYIGMAAIRMDGIMRYDAKLFILSIIVAIILAGIALRLKLWADSHATSGVIFSTRMLIASVMMGCAISGMHYTGMAAMKVFPEPVSHIQTVTISLQTLTNIIVTVAILVTLFLVIAIIVSRRFELYQRIKDSENHLQATLENMVDGVVTIDKRGIIKKVNRAAKAIFGYQTDEMISRNINMLMPEPYTSEHDSYLQNYHETGEAKIIGIDRTVEGLRKDGSTFPMDLAVSEIELEGQPMYTGIIRDITERKQAELALEQYYEQLEELVEKRTTELVTARDEAERASAAKSEFLSQMSHELRTPMNAILGFGQLLELEAKELNETQLDNVKEILKAGDHLLNLIGDLLDLARIESGKLEIIMEEVAIEDVLQQSIVLIKTQAEARQIELINHVKNKNYIVQADFDRLKQVMVNLLSNAVKYNREHGRIILDSEITDKQRLRISVADKGKGLSEEDVKMLFNSFERLNVKNNIEGTGIGLVITKNLIELMGGTIGVESIQGEGSTFWVELAILRKS